MFFVPMRHDRYRCVAHFVIGVLPVSHAYPVGDDNTATVDRRMV